MRLKLILLALLATLPALAGWNFSSDTRYRISCDASDGYVCIGSRHGAAPELYYQAGSSVVSADGWWYVEEQDGQFSIRNAQTGQYLSYCDTYSSTCKYLTLTDKADDDEQWWELTAGTYSGSDYVCIASAASGYIFNLRTSAKLVGTYATFVESQANSRFHFISEKGVEVTYSDTSTPTVDPSPVRLTTIADGHFDTHTIWYRLFIRDNKLLYTNGTAVNASNITYTEAPEQLWCFTRDGRGYYTLYNMSTGAGAPLGSQDAANATPLTVESKNTITAFCLTTNGSGYNLQIPDDYTCANDFGAAGILKYWSNTQAPTDVGSRIIVEEVGEMTIREAIHPQSIECETAMTIPLGTTTTMAYQILPTDATDKRVKMESSDTRVLTVADNGVLTPIATGQAVVTITSLDPLVACQAQCLVTIVDPQAGTTMAHDGRMLHLTRQGGAITALPIDYVKTYTLTDGRLDAILVTDEPLRYDDVVSVSETMPQEGPTFVSYKFNNKFNPQVFTDVVADDPSASRLSLAVGGIGKRLTASFQLSDDAALAWVDGTLQKSKHTRQRFDHPVTYTLGYAHWQQLRIKEMADGSFRHEFIPYGREVTVEVDWLCDHSTLTYGVPEIYITTSDGTPITSKTTYWDATMEVRGGGVFPDMPATSMQIKGRGNTSWGGAGSKNPYRIKFPSKVAPLGMTKGKSWILLANKQTGSMTTNAIGQKIASLMGSAAACHIVPVELYINGKYQGSYNLCEKIGLANNSIALASEIEATAAIIEMDTYGDEGKTNFYSNAYGISSKIHDPDVEEADYTGLLTPEGIINDFDQMTRRVRMRDFEGYVDIESAASYLSTCELMVNSELQHPKSVFLYSENVTDDFDPTGSDPTPWVFGPLWDCDWAFGYEQGHSYYQVEATDDYFSTLLGSGSPRQFWNDLRYGSSALDEAYFRLWHRFMTDGSFDELIEYCDDYYDFAALSLKHNSQGQYASSDNSDYSKVTQNAKQWLTTRARTIFSAINAYDVPRPYEAGDLNGDGDYTIVDMAWLVRVLNGRQMDVYGTADVDGNGLVNINDVQRLLQLIMQHHPEE